MSQKSVDIVRALSEAWNAQDMAGVGEIYHPDAIVRSIEGLPEPGPFVGREAIIGFWKQQREMWDVDAVEPISFHDAGDQVAVRQIWRGSGHGPEFNAEFTSVFTLRDGKIYYHEFFWDHAAALGAVGLSELP